MFKQVCSPFYFFNLSAGFSSFPPQKLAGVENPSNVIIKKKYYNINFLSMTKNMYSDLNIGFSTFIHINRRISFDFFS